MKSIVWAALSAAVAAPAMALEPFRVYDQFTDPIVSNERFTATERVLQVHNGGLILMQRQWPLNFSDLGAGFSSWAEPLTNPNAVTAIRVRANVRALETSSCAANPAIANSRARIIGSFFNVGTNPSSSQVDDVTAQVRINRASNSADAPGVLRVQGLLLRCTNFDCSSTLVIGNIVELGTVTVGQPVVLEMQWDKGGKTFYFTRDRGAASGTVAYAESDAMPPNIPLKQLSTRVDLPNCQSAPRTPALVDVRFDNVQVNQSAAPAP